VDEYTIETPAGSYVLTANICPDVEEVIRLVCQRTGLALSSCPAF
jgi:hypothetical protein